MRGLAYVASLSVSEGTGIRIMRLGLGSRREGWAIITSSSRDLHYGNLYEKNGVTSIMPDVHYLHLCFLGSTMHAFVSEPMET